jgi:alanine racemase
MRSTQLIVNINSIKRNIKSIREYLGSNVKIMPIVKDFAYGTHLNECPDVLNEFEYVGVAYLDEAIKLRQNGYNNQILVLYPLSKEEFELAKEYDFVINGSNIFDIIDSDSKVRVHTEIETGMGRTGLQLDSIDAYINSLKHNKNVSLEGLFTHLSTNSDKEFSLKQIHLFEEAIKRFNDSGIYPDNIHVCSSGGLNYYHDYLYNMVRIGLLIYGYYPNDSLKEILDIEPCMTLKTNISFLKTIKKGEYVGYNKNFLAEKNTVVATIPFGFGDGLLTLETGEPYVLLRGYKAKIIGICMDNMMLDVTDIPNVQLGEEVLIWDNKQLTIEQLGMWCNGICNYEVMSSISERVPRVLKR